MNKNKLNRKISEFLELPKEISSEEPKITILGFNEMLIQNYKGILEYEKVCIRISTHIGIINIIGAKLELNEMNQDDIMILGNIEKIELESVND